MTTNLEKIVRSYVPVLSYSEVIVIEPPVVEPVAFLEWGDAAAFVVEGGPGSTTESLFRLAAKSQLSVTLGESFYKGPPAQDIIYNLTGSGSVRRPHHVLDPDSPPGTADDTYVDVLEITSLDLTGPDLYDELQEQKKIEAGGRRLRNRRLKRSPSVSWHFSFRNEPPIYAWKPTFKPGSH